MAVQKSKVTRRRRGNRRSHDALSKPVLGTDPHTGETHQRHHMTKDGFYRGRSILEPDED